MTRTAFIGALALLASCAASIPPKPHVPSEALPAQAAWIMVMEACAERLREPTGETCGRLPEAPIQTRVGPPSSVWSAILGAALGAGAAAAGVAR